MKSLLFLMTVAMLAVSSQCYKFNGSTIAPPAPPAPPAPKPPGYFSASTMSDGPGPLAIVSTTVELANGFMSFIASLKSLFVTAGFKTKCDALTTCENSCCVRISDGLPFCVKETAMESIIAKEVSISCGALSNLMRATEVALVGLVLLMLVEIS
jgi:hypothetical protein